MRIAYCTNVRLPSERAHGHQIASVCNALIDLHHEVTLFAPYRRNVISEDYWTYYGARREVGLQHLGNFDPIACPWLPGVLGLFVLNRLYLHALRGALRDYRPFDLLYTRSPALLDWLLRVNVPVILELHTLPRWGRRRFVANCKRCCVVVCLTNAMRENLMSWGVPETSVIVEGDAVNLKRFEQVSNQHEARRHLQSISNFQFPISNQFSIFNDRIVVGYVGRLKTLGMEKGAAVLLEALHQLKSAGKYRVLGLIVGGPEKDRRAYEKMGLGLGLGLGTDVIFTGEIPSREVPNALAACDVLVYPAPKSAHPYFQRDTSPLKLFEYMASGKAIVCADLPPLHDTVDATMVRWVTPGDPAALAKGISDAVTSPKESADRGRRARKVVERHTWKERMERILRACGARRAERKASYTHSACSSSASSPPGRTL